MIDYSTYEFLKIEVAERVATVTLNRPAQLNAVNAALHHEFEQIWLELAQDRDVNAILLTGAGPAFSVGGDLTSRDKPTKSKGRGGRRIVMADGRVLELRPSDAVMSEPAHERTRQFLRAVVDR